MTELTIELIDWCHEKGVLGTFTFDSFYTCAPIQNHINSLKNGDETVRGYVGDLKFKDDRRELSCVVSRVGSFNGCLDCGAVGVCVASWSGGCGTS